jgi:hypothetical protein
MMRRLNKKRGSIELSFGMIFSIILVVIFLAVAFYVIKKFMDFQNDAKILQFKDNVQKDIDDLWRSSQGTYEGVYSVPSGVKSVCFVDDPYENMVFSPNTIKGVLIVHIDLAKTLGEKTSLCFSNVNNVIKISMGKDYGDNFVTLS